MMRWSLALVFAGLAGLLVQADLGAAAKKKKPATGGSLDVKSELTEKDNKDKVRKDSYCKIFTFKMVKGQTYQIDMKSKDIDSYLRLEDPDGKQVAADDDSGGFPDARITYKAADSGDFKIIATTYGGDSTGAFTLTAVDKAEKKEVKKDAGAAIELKNEKGQATYTGNIVDGDLLYKGKKHKLFTFQMEEGKTYQIDHMSKDFDAYLYLEAPDGKLIAQDDDGGEGLNSRIVYKAEKSGRYRMIATSLGGSRTGEFTFIVTEK